MFPVRYFNLRYFASRFWAKVGAEPAPEVAYPALSVALAERATLELILVEREAVSLTLLEG